MPEPQPPTDPEVAAYAPRPSSASVVAANAVVEIDHIPTVTEHSPILLSGPKCEAPIPTEPQEVYFHMYFSKCSCVHYCLISN